MNGGELSNIELSAWLPPVEPLRPQSAKGRVFAGARKVRLGDVDPQGRLRFDGLTRYTQDVSNDDTTDAGMPDVPGWVVRSTVVDELVPGQLGESLAFETFCSGLGKRWAERRLTVRGDAGAHYEVATLWVCIDVTSGAPTMLTENFLEIYGSAADGRKASARQQNPKLATVVADGGQIEVDSWQLRRADYDTLGHVNNAAYWAAVEEWMAPFAGGRRARVEYGKGLAPAPRVGIARLSTENGLAMWWVEGDGSPSATASVTPLPSDLY